MHKGLVLSVLLLLLVVAAVVAASPVAGQKKCTVDDRTGCGSYVAAVVEYGPVFIHNDGHTDRGQALAVMRKNLDAYDKFAAQAVSNEDRAQIIVFPEYGLTGPSFTKNRDSVLPYLEPLPPNPKSLSGDVKPCFEPEKFPDSPVFVQASCIAAQNKITLVFNMAEIQTCDAKSDPRCPKDGRYQFNTLVAFSDDGSFLAKYRKTNLYEEPWFDAPVDQPPIWFESSFGARFGMLICFDMMWGHPALDLLAKENHIREFVFSSWWVNFPPALMANEMQLAWARRNQANLLASNSGHNWRSSGSGIYSNGDALATTYNNGSTPGNNLLIAKIPRNPFDSKSRIPPVTSKSPSSSSTTYAPAFSLVPFTVQPNMAKSLQATANNVKCHFNFTTNNNIGDAGAAYSLVAVSGGWWPLLPVEYCGVLSCGSRSEADCKVELNIPILKGEARFSSFSLQGQFSSNTTVFSLANSDGGQLMDSLAYNVEVNAQRTNILQSVSYRDVDDQTVLNIALLARSL